MAVCLICTACFAASPAAAYTPGGARHAHPSRSAPALTVTVQPTANGGDRPTLQAAFDALQPGQRLVLAPGRYTVGRSLTVSKANVVISGYGATLVATDPANQTILMSGSGSTLVGVTLVGTGTTRLTTPASTKVEVTGTGVQVLGVTIQGGASAGSSCSAAAAWRSWATPWRRRWPTASTTYGSTNVLVRGNTVKNTGDDLIAVVSYQGTAASAPTC